MPERTAQAAIAPETSPERMRRFEAAGSFDVLYGYIQDAKRDAKVSTEDSLGVYYRKIANEMPLHIPRKHNN